jgi:hypothetical protein
MVIQNATAGEPNNISAPIKNNIILIPFIYFFSKFSSIGDISGP